jgi:hypothetical protein
MIRSLAVAMVAGAVLGLASRVAMRLVAFKADVAPGFSLGGSIEVVLFGMLIGTPIALVVSACRRRFSLPAWTGVAVGLALFASFTVWQPPAARSALSTVPDAAFTTAACFAAAFVLYGVVLDVLWACRRDRLI